MNRDLAAVADIVESARSIGDYIAGVSRNEFIENEQLQDSVIRRLLVIGEAAGRLSASFRDARPGVPWREIRGMRNRMVHVYDDIDVKLVWRTVRNDVPRLLAELAPIVSSDSEALSSD
ncbi:MAG: DUF86 domain-containing protein [Acidobacteria bacterium]|nr:DUF86 domain-containing protein [Acidobacteriota bacterium]